MELTVSKRTLRILLVAGILLPGTVLTVSVLSASDNPRLSDNSRVDTYREQASLSYEERDKLVDDRNGTTVITAGTGVDGAILAYSPSGRIEYYNETYDSYADVDPVPNTSSTVLYVANSQVEIPGCPNCLRNVVETVNLSTGETRRLHTHIDYFEASVRWHDVDQLDDSRLLVADIDEDTIFVVNTTTDQTDWLWRTQSEYQLSSGGSFPDDWTHVNDIDRVEEGRYMVSLRNQDRVVFVDRETGLDEAWTLGTEDNYSRLYEQHNPDYIPEENGGPAVLVADSENNRIVEYQRTADGKWTQSWNWQSVNLQWPRDADRLPNGHTLIAATNSNRVIEVNQDGDVIWSVPFTKPYDVERVKTGDGSTGGPSANKAGLTAVNTSGVERSSGETQNRSLLTSLSKQVWFVIKDAIPSWLLNAVLFVMPSWIQFTDLPLLVLMGGSTFSWAIFEFRWSRYQLRSPLSRTE